MFGELEECGFECVIVLMHAVQAAQPKLLHESTSVFRICEAEQLDCCVGMAGGEDATHHPGDM